MSEQIIIKSIEIKMGVSSLHGSLLLRCVILIATVKCVILKCVILIATVYFLDSVVLLLL